MVQNGRISDFHGLLTLTLTFDPGMVVTFCSSLIEYYLYTKFHRNRRNTDTRTYGRTEICHPYIVLGRLPNFGSRPKNRFAVLVSGREQNFGSQERVTK